MEQRGSNWFKLMFRWSAGHIGIVGNEEADKQAKTAADSKSSEKTDLPPCLQKKIGHSLSVVQEARNKKLKLKWNTTWTKSPRYRHLKFKDLLTPPSQKS